MYFIKRSSKVYHILGDDKTGEAPDPCGAQADPLTMAMYRMGKPTTGITKEKPTDYPLCKHCQEARRWEHTD